MIRRGTYWWLLAASGCVVAAPAEQPAPTAAPATVADAGTTEAAPVVEPAPEKTLTPATGWRNLRPKLAVRPALSPQRVVRGGLGANFAPDGDTLLVVRGRGATLLSPGGSGRKPRQLPGRIYVKSRFAPDSRHVAVMDDKRRLLVVDAATGKRVAEIKGADRPRWLDASTLAFQRGCSAYKLPLGGREVAIGAAPTPCGQLVRASADGRTWWLASRGRYRRGVLQTYKRLVAYDLVANKGKLLLDGTDDAHFMMPDISADGRRVCFVDAQFDLYCRTDAADPERIWRNARRPVLLDDSGRWLLFAVGKHTSGNAEIAVVDLDERVITWLPRAGRQWWVFLDGGRRIAGHGGKGSAIVYDLAAGWQAKVGDDGGEWEGLYPAPGRPDRFIVGRERGGTRDLYLATIR